MDLLGISWITRTSLGRMLCGGVGLKNGLLRLHQRPSGSYGNKMNRLAGNALVAGSCAVSPSVLRSMQSSSGFTPLVGNPSTSWARESIILSRRADALDNGSGEVREGHGGGDDGSLQGCLRQVPADSWHKAAGVRDVGNSIGAPIRCPAAGANSRPDRGTQGSRQENQSVSTFLRG
jgi:hypothetical protein